MAEEKAGAETMMGSMTKDSIMVQCGSQLVAWYPKFSGPVPGIGHEILVTDEKNGSLGTYIVKRVIHDVRLSEGYYHKRVVLKVEPYSFDGGENATQIAGPA